MEAKFLLLFFLFQIKHFITDGPLQFDYMTRKNLEIGWEWPLISHSLVCGFFAFLVSIFFVSAPMAIAIGFIDAVSHFLIDRIKSSSKLLGRFHSLTKEQFFNNPTKEKLFSNRMFWNAVCLDQTLHQFVYGIFIYFILSL